MPHALSTSQLINQVDSSIQYPGGGGDVFHDLNFYSYCGKTGAIGTIAENGCAICDVAMFSLYKGGLSNSNDNTYYSVAYATEYATNSAADLYTSGFSYTVTIGGQNISVTSTVIPDVSAQVQVGNVCMVRLYTDPNHSHYVIVDGWDSSASGFYRYLVCDPSGGVYRTLADVMQQRFGYQDASLITQKYLLS